MANEIEVNSVNTENTPDIPMFNNEDVAEITDDLLFPIRNHLTTPSYTPKKFVDSFYAFNDGTGYKLYTYDQYAKDWTYLYGYVSPLTTKGDLMIRNSSIDTRLPVGSNGQVLTADSGEATGVKWADQNVTATNVSIQTTAGEDMDGTLAPLGVFVADDNSYNGVIQNLSANAFVSDFSTSKWYGQTFTTPSSPVDNISLSNVLLSLKKSSGTTGTLYVRLFATSGGLPTGSALVSDSLDISTLSDTDFSAIQFSLSYSLSAGTKYAIILDTSGLTGGSLVCQYQNTDVYDDGDAVVTSTSGSSWGLFTTLGVYHDFYFNLNYTYTFGTEGYIYKSDPDAVGRNKYHGIVKTAITASEVGNMIVEGAVSGFSTLEPGELYYIQNDQSVGLTKTSLLIGRAVKADTINIIKQGGSNVYIGAIASDVLRESGDTERTFTTSGSSINVKLKEFIAPITGFYRIKFDLKSTVGANQKTGRIYKNGIAYGTANNTTSTTYVNYSEDLFFVAGDLVQLYCAASYGGINESGAIRNFRIYYSIGEIPVDDFTGLISLD